jgi:MMPL family
MATAGRTVIFSGLTVSTSLLSLLLFPLNIMRSIGLGAISAVLMAMLASLTLLPIVLALLGPRVNALSLRRFIRSRRTRGVSTNAGEQQGMWYRLSEMIMRRPIPVVLILVTFLSSLVIPFSHIKLATTDVNILPADSQARVVSQRLSRDFAHQGNAQLTIAITTPGNALSPENLARLDNYVKSLQTIPGVVQVQSVVTVSPALTLPAYQQIYAHPELNPQVTQVATYLANDDFTKITVAIQPADHTSEATTLVKQIRALQAPAGLTAQVTGITPIEIDLVSSINALLPEALLVIFASIFVLLFLMTGSLIMPLKAIILNMLSLSATFGGLVWIFQDGHLQDILHFQSVGSIDATLPVIIFAIAFGLSMDYEVFVLSRIKECFDETGNNRLAVSSGIQRTGQLVTSAALLMAVAEGGFGLAKILSIQEIGIGIAIAVIMDATLIRMLLLPATMRLLGTFNWWAPAPLRWLWQYIGLKETASTPALAFHGQAGRDEPQTLWEAAASSTLPPMFRAQAGRDEPLPPREAAASLTLAPVLHGHTGKDEPLYGIGNEILTGQHDSTKHEASLVESSLLLPVDEKKVAPERSNHVISTQTASGEEIMDPEILLWHYPEKNVINGSRLSVESNQFCVLKARGTILKVYETGQHRVQMSEDPLGSVQLTFNGEPIPLEYEVLYINRAQLAGKASGVTLSHDMAEVDYSVDYSIHIATREDAVQLVQHMSYRSHPLGQAQGLQIEDINAYVGPMIEQTVKQLSLRPVEEQMGVVGIVQISGTRHRVSARHDRFGGAAPIPMTYDQGLQMQEISQLVYEGLQQFLSTYGITVNKVKVRVVPRGKDMKAPLSLKDSGLSKIDALHHYTAMTNNSTGQRTNYQKDHLEHKMYQIRQNRLDRYTDEIAALQAELESIRADFGLRMDTHSARLQELLHVINSDLRESTLDMDSGGTSPQPTVLPKSHQRYGTTGQVRAR